MRRFRQELSRKECDEVLVEGMRGVMALLGDDDYPYAVPLDYLYEPSEGRIYFHGARGASTSTVPARATRWTPCAPMRRPASAS